MADIKLDGPIEALVVEDNHDEARSVKRALEVHPAAEFRVRSAPTLRDGLAELARGPTDVVMLDLHLPDAQGVDLVKAIKGAAPNIGVIVVTGWPIDEVRAEMRAAGAEAVLAKPVDPGLLAAKLQYSVLYHRSGAAQFRAAVEATLANLGAAIVELAQQLTESGKVRTLAEGPK